MPRRSCLTDLIIAEDLVTGMTDQGEPVEVVKTWIALSVRLSVSSPTDQEDGSNGDPSRVKPLGRRVSKLQNFPPFKRRYRDMWGDPGLLA